MLVNFKEMMNNAKNGKYAVPQFNINNLEWTKYILEVCKELNVPVIYSPATYAVFPQTISQFSAVASEVSIPSKVKLINSTYKS